MGVTFTAEPEEDLARVKITAQGGTPGDSFYILRRDDAGSRLVRDTSVSSVVWQPDPASTRHNLASNPSLEVSDAGWGPLYGNGGNQVYNFATNPTMNPLATTKEFMRNRAINPQWTGGSSGVPAQMSAYSFGTVTGTRDNTTVPGAMTVSTTSITANGRWGVYYSSISPSGNGNVPITMKVHFEKTGDANINVVMWADFYSGSTNVGTDISIPRYTGTSGDIVFKVKPGANFDNVKLYFWMENVSASTITTPTTVTFTNPIMATGEGAWNSELVNYFDGSMEADADSTYSWSFVNNASDSIRTINNIGQYVAAASTSIAAISPNGSQALAIQGNNASINNTYASLVGDSGAIRLGLIAGLTYRLTATITLLAPQTGTLNVNARRVGVYTKVGSNPVVETLSAQAPNVAGDTQIDMTFTVPSGATEAYVRLYNGAALGNGVTMFSDVNIYVSAYTGGSFSGDSTSDNTVTYSWSGTPSASGSYKTAAVGRTPYFLGTSAEDPLLKTNVYQVVWAMPSTQANGEGFSFVENISGSAGDTYSMRIRAMSDQTRDYRLMIRFRNGSFPVGELVSPPITGPSWTWKEFTLFGATATGSYDNIYITLTRDSGPAFGPDSAIRADGLILEKAATSPDFFDGSSYDPAYNGWDGTPGLSRSYLSPTALDIVVYDYEARQGLSTDYIMTTETGDIGASVNLVIPRWGTWLKDPFRPFVNVKVMWHSDDEWSRKARRVLLQAKNSRFPVAQWDSRIAPNGTVKITAENADVSAAIDSLLQTAGVVMIDVDERFNVPVRYVSVGDVSTARPTSDSGLNLKWDARIWTLEVDEVEYPIGVPVTQSLSYSQIPQNFSSYIDLVTRVASYDDLAIGNWNR